MQCLIVLICAVPTKKNTSALNAFKLSILQWRTVCWRYIDIKYINYVTPGVAAPSFHDRKEVTTVNGLTEPRALHGRPTPRGPELPQRSPPSQKRTRWTPPSPPARMMFGLKLKPSTFSATPEPYHRMQLCSRQTGHRGGGGDTDGQAGPVCGKRGRWGIGFRYTQLCLRLPNASVRDA